MVSGPTSLLTRSQPLLSEVQPRRGQPPIFSCVATSSLTHCDCRSERSLILFRPLGPPSLAVRRHSASRQSPRSNHHCDLESRYSLAIPTDRSLGLGLRYSPSIVPTHRD